MNNTAVTTFNEATDSSCFAFLYNLAVQKNLLLCYFLQIMFQLSIQMLVYLLFLSASRQCCADEVLSKVNLELITEPVSPNAITIRNAHKRPLKHAGEHILSHL